MADLDIKSETIDKAIDKLVEPVYNDVAKPTIETSRDALGFCSKFIVSGIKPFMYSKIKECEYKIKEIDKKLEEKYNKIPNENKTEPRTNILGPAVDVLKYNLNEDYIKDMFVNLIGNDLDKTKQSRVLPSYIEIIKQLSAEDALFLKLLKTTNFLDNASIPILRLKLENKNDYSYIYISDYVICTKLGDYIHIPPIVLDNLLRLQLFSIPAGVFIHNLPDYDKTFEKLKSLPQYNKQNLSSDKHIACEKSKLDFTDFGKNFIDICLS